MRGDLSGSAVLFPAEGAADRTALLVTPDAGRYPVTAWLGSCDRLGADSTGVPAAVGVGRQYAGEPAPVGTPLLPEHWRGIETRPGLRGFRIADDGTVGRDWSTQLAGATVEVDAAGLRISAADQAAGLAVLSEMQAVAGGALRIRHTLSNTGPGRYVLEALEVVLPLPDDHDEVLDFTGRHERERSPQRRRIADGLWLREGRRGKTGLDAATMIVTGRAGFAFAGSDVVAVHVGWSGNVTLGVERSGATGTVVLAGETLLSGEITLATGESHRTPWVYVVATSAGLDGVAAAFHTFARSLPTHPGLSPVTLNVWEAVYFEHDLTRLTQIAALAASVGVERFVLDDGWFHLRRDDHAGLGDWWIDPAVWPDGLQPLIDEVTSRGMSFGLWFEPEMVNPDSDLYRSHPDWVLSTGGRVPLLHRNQLLLDLGRDEVRQYLFDRVSTVLSAHDIGYVKWDHNRDLLEAGSAASGGAAGVHAQTLGFYRLLDDLRAAHPGVVWESCASGGGRIDLGVLERVERVWTSDMTDALSRQSIQRWTGQLVAPEYLGAHVSAPTSHQTGRTYTLAFRAATALFGAFGIEWDITTATPADLQDLSEWVGLYKEHRELLQTGRMVRMESADQEVLLHGVVATDGREALLAHVQLGESAHNRGVVMRVPGLADAVFHATWAGPTDRRPVSAAPPVHADGPTAGEPVSGTVLGGPGLWFPRRQPESILLTHLRARG